MLCADVVRQVYGEFREFDLFLPEAGKGAKVRGGCGKTQLSHTMSVIAQVGLNLLILSDDQSLHARSCQRCGFDAEEQRRGCIDNDRKWEELQGRLLISVRDTPCSLDSQGYNH